METNHKRKKTRMATTLAVSSIILLTATHKVLSYASGNPLRLDTLFRNSVFVNDQTPKFNPDTTYQIMPMDFEKVTSKVTLENVRPTVQASIQASKFLYDSQSDINSKLIPTHNNLIKNNLIKVINPKSPSLESMIGNVSDSNDTGSLYAAIKVLTSDQRANMLFASHISDSLYIMKILDTVSYYSQVVDKELVMSLIQNESHFVLDSKVSSAGARGPMQLVDDGWYTVMPSSSSYIPNVYKPKLNIEAGIKLCLWLEKYGENNYSELTKKHKYIGWNNVNVSLERKRDIIAAAYNAGIGRLSGLYGDPKKNRPKELRWIIYSDLIPGETKSYVTSARTTYNVLQEKKFRLQSEKLLADK